MEALLQQNKDEVDLQRRMEAGLEARLAALRRRSLNVTPPPMHAATSGRGVTTTTTGATQTPLAGFGWMCCGQRPEEDEDEDEDAAADRYVRQVQEEVRLEAMLPDVPSSRLRASAADSPSIAGDHTGTSDDGGGAVAATHSGSEGSEPHPHTEPPSRRWRDTSNDSEAHLSKAVELIDDYFVYAKTMDVRRIKANARKRPPAACLPPSYHAAVCSDGY